jgi:hypothetical protein
MLRRHPLPDQDKQMIIGKRFLYVGIALSVFDHAQSQIQKGDKGHTVMTQY